MLAGIPVPEGVVITTAANEASLESSEFRGWLAALPVGTLLAVRSSGAEEDSVEHSFAGIYETRLNVGPKDVSEAVRACWASAISPAALAYRRARHLTTETMKIAVLIQRMIQPVASGVGFTVNPISGSTDELLIDSVFGLGEALVSGLVEPDEFKIRKRDCEVLSSHVAGTTASLTNERVQELSALLLRIEAYFGGAQDVEWCHDGSQFWIVQSRPVTSGSASHKKDIEWTRANAREVLPDLASPMAIYSIAYVVEKAERKFYGKLLAPESDLGKMAQVFYGRLFFNVDQFRYICKLAGTPPAHILRAVGHEGDIAPSDELVQRRSLIEVLRVLPDLIRFASQLLTVKKRVGEQLARSKRYLEELHSLDFSKLSDRDMWAENRKWRPRLIHELQLVFTLAAVSTYEGILQTICKRVRMPYERLAYTHLAAGGKSVSSLQAFDLLRLVQVARGNGGDLSSDAFRSQFDNFLEKYGHRGRYESDIAMPRYVEDPSALLFTIQSHLQSPQRHDPDEMMKRQDAEAAKAWREFEHKLSAWQRLWLAPRTRWLLRRIKQFYVWRELIRSEMLRLALPMRRLHLEMAERFVRRGWIESQNDYFYLTLPDVDAVIDGHDAGSSLRSIIARRKSEWAWLSKLDVPLLLRESQLPSIARNLTNPVSPVTNEPELRGLCVSAGYAEGEVVVMQDPSEFSRMKPGAILVAPGTDPSWTPLFTLASGVIVEIGGILSHASTVAREYGLPALANVRHATKILKDGERVRLDATNGTVQRL
jgi:rifampicin phosphotransferase